MAILILKKFDFRAKNIIRNKECHFVMLEVNLSEGNNKFKHVYTNNRTSKYIKQILVEIQGKMIKSTIIVRFQHLFYNN